MGGAKKKSLGLKKSWWVRGYYTLNTQYAPMVFNPIRNKHPMRILIRSSIVFYNSTVSCCPPQCKPSRGRKRGICWCVDKYGVQLPGTDYSGGDIQCKDLESSSNNNNNNE